MATSNFSIKYRPVRIGFLVKHGQINDIVRASRINTLLWGGIYNPIIPVSKDEDFSKQLIKLFNVDVWFAISNTKEIETLLKQYEYLKSPNYYGREVLYKEHHSKKYILGYLDIINIINFYWDEEFKNKSNEYKSNCALIEWDKNDTLANLFATIFGDFPRDINLKYDYRTIFLKGLKAKRILLKNKENINSELNQMIYPLVLTRDRLHGYGKILSKDGVYIGNSDSFDDLIAFWNLRASGIDLHFLPINSKRLNPFINKHLSKLDKKPNRHTNIEDFIFIYHRNNKNKEFDFSNFKTKKEKVYHHVTRTSWNGLNIKPLNFYFDSSQVLGNINYKFEKYCVSIALPEKPIKETNRNKFQNIVVVVDTISEDEYLKHTLKLPFIQELNEFYSREIVFDSWELRVDKEGIGLINKISNNVIKLWPILNNKIIEKVFDFAEIKNEMSQPGRLAYHIIHQMREYGPLDACRVFKIKGVRELVKNIPCNESIKWEDALKIIGESDFDKFKNLVIERRNEKELKVQDVFNFLIKKKIFSPFLPKKYSNIKKSFICKRCGLESEIDYGKFSREWVCDYCKFEHYLPEFISSEFKRKEKYIWNFKKSGLFSKDNNQEGAIPVILTLLQIKRLIDKSNFIYTTSHILKTENGKECETDLIILNYKRGYDIEIGIGECKSDFGVIDEENIEKLINIKSILEKKDFKCYLIFAKTAYNFTDEEINLFKNLVFKNKVFERIYPILFTNKELEPYDPYEEYHENDLYRRCPLNLEDMSINSAKIYLDYK